jgi:hypothetical protein
MRRTTTAITALAAALAASAAHARSPVMLQPLGDWEAGEASEDSCTVTRLFGDANAPHMVRFGQNWPSTGTSLWVAGPALSRFIYGETANLRLNDQGRKLTIRPVAGMLPGLGKAVVTTLSHDTIDQSLRKTGARKARLAEEAGNLSPDKGAAVRFLGMKRGSDPEVRYNTGGLDVPFAMLNQCTDGLLARWGLDPQKHRTATSQARMVNEAEITRKIMRSYPRAGLARGERGKIGVRLVVEQGGGISDCAIIKEATTANLTAPVCEIMAEARFTPALDGDGQPFRSFFGTMITYEIGF